MVRAIVAGAAGRMGGRIIHMIRQSKDVELGAAFERPEHPSVHQDAGQVAGLGNLGIQVAGSLEEVAGRGEVLIDFTHPEATVANLRTAAGAGLALVIGTTGIAGKMLEEVKELAKGVRCVLSPNMSVGVNVMFRIAGEMAKILGKDYDMEILEVHHRFKKDAPSGTARRLGEIAAAAYGLPYDEAVQDGRSGIVSQDRPKNQVGMHAVRGGDIVGDHTVLFAGMGERIELRHMMHSRSTLARGAVAAAIWLSTQKSGYYSMRDVLGF